MKRPKKVRFEFVEYTPAALLNRDYKEVRKEYSRLRSIARKRLERLQTSPEYSNSAAARNYAEGFKPVAQLTERDLVFELVQVQRFLDRPSNSIAGLRYMKERNIETLKRHGYTFVNAQNYDQFGEFMEELRTRNEELLYDSERAVEAFEKNSREMNPKQLADWFEAFQEEQRLDQIKNKRPRGSAELVRKARGGKK